MATSDERIRILKMIEDGRVSPDEGSRILAALQTGQPRDAEREPARWVRILVTEAGYASPNVNVRIPAGLLRAVAGLAGPHLERHGVDVDEILNQIRSGSTGHIVEVEGDGTRVEVLVE